MLNDTWVAIVAGAAAGIASAPHCFAMCGPLALFAVSGGARGSAPSRIARYQLGRIASYGVLGAIAGSSGGALTAWLPPRATAIALAAVVAGAMLFAAYRLVQKPRTPKPITLRTSRGAPPLSARLLAYAPREPAWIGVFSALLPCGALYTAALLAVGTGTWSSGAIAMIAFAVTSGLGLALSAVLGERARVSLLGRRILAGAMVLGAIVVLLRPVLMHSTHGAAHTEPEYGCGH